MKRLLQLNISLNWGSTGKIAEGIAAAARESGWETFQAYGGNHRESEQYAIRAGGFVDRCIHYGLQRLFDSEGLHSKFQTERLISHIEKLAPDIIHLHNIHDHWLNYTLFFEYLATIKTPVVWTFHDCWAFTGGCYHFENEGCYQWSQPKGCQKCKCNRGLIYNNTEHNFRLRKDSFLPIIDRLTIVAVSEWIANFVKKSFLGKACADIRIIHNGIDVTNTFRPTLSTIQKEKMILGVANKWTKDKGLDDFIRLRELLSPDYSIYLIGLSQEQINKLPSGIHGIGRTDCVDDLAGYYNRASVFVNPTYNDSFPTVNLEALACGTPVITYRTGGSPEAVDDKTGIVVEKGDINSIAYSIRDIIGHPERFTRDDCRKRAETRFNKDIQFNKYIDLYAEILNR